MPSPLQAAKRVPFMSFRHYRISSLPRGYGGFVESVRIPKTDQGWVVWTRARVRPLPFPKEPVLALTIGKAVWVQREQDGRLTAVFSKPPSPTALIPPLPVRELIREVAERQIRKSSGIEGSNYELVQNVRHDPGIMFPRPKIERTRALTD